MKKRIRLKNNEALSLGFELKEKQGTNNPKYSLNQQQIETLNKLRNNGILSSCEKLEVDPSTVKHLWKKTNNESVFVKNPLYVTPLQKEYFTLRDELLKDIKKFKPSFPKIKRNKIKDGHLLVIDPADLHIGKLASSFETGEDYNNQIAVKRAKEGVQGILDKAQGFNIDKIMFVGGNDILHIDTPTRTTTSGTPQDTDGMWYDNFIIAKKLYIDLLQTLLSVADVHFVFNPSNHDYTNGFFLADVIQTYFKDCSNITFDCDISHRKYYRYYDSLIGTTHGDGAKTADLPLLMAHESKDWSDCKHRYVYTHHIHHKVSKDYMGVCVESLRSPSAADSWHSRNGYVHAPQAIEGFLHSKNHGQVCRFSHIF